MTSIIYICYFQTHRCAYCPLRTRLNSGNVTSRGLRQFRILYKAGSCHKTFKHAERKARDFGDSSRHSIDINLLEPKIRTISTSTCCLTREFLRTVLDFVAKNVASCNIVRTLPLRTARTTKHDDNINQATARTRSNIAFFSAGSVNSVRNLFCFAFDTQEWCELSHAPSHMDCGNWALCWHSAVGGEGWCSCGTWGQGSLPEKWSQCFPCSRILCHKGIDLLKKGMGVHTD